MNFFDIITRVFAIVPDAIKAVRSLSEAAEPGVIISSKDATLWHTVTYDEPIDQAPYFAGRLCTVCQKRIAPGFANELCSEAVRRRNAGLT